MDYFQVEVRTTNAAFDEDAVPELVRVLREVIQRLEGGETNGNLRDGNGNSVGSFGES
jgi:hypothetical protein